MSGKKTLNEFYRIKEGLMVSAPEMKARLSSPQQGATRISRDKMMKSSLKHEAGRGKRTSRLNIWSKVKL